MLALGARLARRAPGPPLARLLHTSPPRALRPPSPASLGPPVRARASWPPRAVRRLALASALVAAGVLADDALNGSSLRRTARTFATGALAAADYKLNFRPVPWTGGTVKDLHERNARRLADLLVANGGLYLKMGQAIAVQGAALPAEFQRMFARMFDDADADAFADVEAVVREDFGGRSVAQVFGPAFERTPRASASIAQVHRAVLPDGRVVAVKVQKRAITRQMAWDLWAYRSVMWIYSRWFDLPLYNFVHYISERLQLETDFENEAENGRRMRAFVAGDARMRGRVYVPEVYADLTTKRVLTAEWIDGPKLYDTDALTKRYTGPGGAGGGGLGLSTRDVMSIIVDLFSAQIFAYGDIHCDPHPANIIVRRQPSGKPQVVLIDHGLYVRTTPEFRRQYARLWRALLTLNDTEIRAVTQHWGIRAPELFASATMNRPYGGGDGRAGFDGAFDEHPTKTPEERQFEMQQRMRDGIRDIFADEQRLPRELLFIGRNLRIVQGLNQRFGSPVNRIRSMGEWASRSLVAADARAPHDASWRAAASRVYDHAVFSLVLALSDLAYWAVAAGAWLGVVTGGAAKGGLDEIMDRRMKSMAKDMGVELQEDVSMFSG